MTAWTLLLHLVNFLAPALGVALLLTLALWGRRGFKRFRWLRAWSLLALAGVAVLTAGLYFYGRDGTMATYAVLVLVMGAVALGLSRRGPGRR